MRFVQRNALFYLFSCAFACFLFYTKTVNREHVKEVIYRSSFCQCSRLVPMKTPSENPSIHWCNEESTLRGFNQKVIGLSLYGNASVLNEISRYFVVLKKIPIEIGEYFPDWRIRIYHAFMQNDTQERDIICQAYCNYDNVDLCDVNEIVSSLSHVKTQGNKSVPVLPGDLAKMNRMNWRYLPMVDPRVDVMAARDSDSQVNSREAAAVNQWLNSDYTFHIMRDHEGHHMPIMGGMFGAKVFRNRPLVQGLMKAMIQLGTTEGYNEDQSLLAKIFWPTAKDDAVINDSYYCQNDWNSLPITPYPTRRDPVQLLFVTEQIGGYSPKPGICPTACRPPDHQDWDRC